jgi:hypothetical protein
MVDDDFNLPQNQPLGAAAWAKAEMFYPPRE